MSKQCAFLMFTVALTGTAHAQIQMNYQLDPSSSTRFMRPIDLGGGTTQYVCERKFGWDSTHVSLLTTTAPDHTLIDASAFRGHSPLTFLFDVEPLGSGRVLCGSQTSGGLTYGFVTHLTSTGVPDWSKSIDNIGGVGYFQDQVACMIPTGTYFMAYTKRSGILAGGSFRIFGDETGTTWGGQQMTAPSDALYNVYGGIGSPIDEHTLYGSGAFSSSDHDRNLMVMRTALSGATWMKFYDMLPSASAQSEDTFTLINTADGNLLLAGYFTTGATTYEGCLLKLAPDGSLLWCRRYADASGGLTVHAVVEMPGGELLAAGTDAYYQIMVLDLGSDGSLVGARRYQAPTVAADFIQGFFTNGAGELKLIAADKVINFSSGGASCDFIPVTSVTSTLHAPTVTDHAMSNAPFTPSTTALNTHARANDLSWTPTCVLNAVGEFGVDGTFVVHPIPTDGIAHIGGSTVLDARERVILRDLSGAVHYDGRYGDGLDLQQFAPGLYLCEVPRFDWRAKVLKE
ncbi:MAG: delta-60 repeat domain-containing protein [Flavobacteriales bacterium]|nr:delta-60 repeat domain-containing protein [Flavobacteriales bacterium]